MASHTSADRAPESTNPENNARKITLHVLCPSLPGPNRFTFDEVALSTTVGALKSRLTETIPTRPPATSQRLIYCGRALTNDERTLESILQPGGSTEYSMHLALPLPRRPSSPSISSTSMGQEAPRARVQQIPHHAGPPFPPLDNQTFLGPGINTRVRFRGPAPPPGLSEADIGLALRRNIDAIRQQLEQQHGGLPTQPRTETATASLSNPLFPQQNAWPRSPNEPPNPLHPSAGQSTFTTTTRAFTMPHSTAAPGSATVDRNASGIQLPEDSRARLQILQAQLAICESQLSRGNSPAIEQIVNMRTQLLNLLDEQYRNPLLPRDGVIESLLSRIFNLYTRADQLRVTHSRSAAVQNITTIPSPQITNDLFRTLYLLTSPDGGYQAMVASPGGAGTIPNSLPTPTMQMPGAVQDQRHPPVVQPNPDPAVLHNAVRQAVLNPHAPHHVQIGVGRHLRRIWLFMRLYFFCYMFSEPGTWTRIVLVSLAVLASLLSETGVPQRLRQVIVTPVQQHIESLVQIGPDRNTGTQRATDGTTPGEGRGARFDILRRVERSVALFIASLVPGVGERHVEVRNAAEAAERARVEEQRRQEESQGANATQQPGDESTMPHVEEREQEATTDHDSQYDTPAEEGRGQREH